jgi:hypothetical protein
LTIGALLCITETLYTNTIIAGHTILSGKIIIMAVFNSIFDAVAFVWALPYGIGKLFSIGGLFYVGIKGHHYLDDKTK